MIDCSQLTGRMKDICEGAADVSSAKRQKYLDRWRAAGLVTENLLPQPEPRPRRKRPGTGPGSELKKMLAAKGYQIEPGCGCTEKVVQMNRWGVSGCVEHLDTIVGWIEEAAKKAGWKEYLAVSTPGLSSVARREIVKLVNEAIRRAMWRQIDD